MKTFFILLAAVFFCTPSVRAQDGMKAVSGEELLQNIAAQTQREERLAQPSAPQRVLLRAISDGDADTLEALKYNKQIAAVLPVLQDEEGNNVFHLAYDENTVQFIAFALRNADAKNGGANQIKALLEQPNAQGQTPVFKALADGKANVYAMYGGFMELPKLLKRAAVGEENERAEKLALIRKHLQDRTHTTLLQAGKLALEKAETAAAEELRGEEKEALRSEVKQLEAYAENLFAAL